MTMAIDRKDNGSDGQVYTTVLSDMFVGVKFSVLSETLYLKLGKTESAAMI